MTDHYCFSLAVFLTWFTLSLSVSLLSLGASLRQCTPHLVYVKDKSDIQTPVSTIDRINPHLPSCVIFIFMSPFIEGGNELPPFSQSYVCESKSECVLSCSSHVTSLAFDSMFR